MRHGFSGDRVVCPKCKHTIYVGPKKLILEALEKNGELDWKGLVEKTELSKGTVSRHLNGLIDEKVVVFKAITRPLRASYYLNPTTLGG